MGLKSVFNKLLFEETPATDQTVLQLLSSKTFGMPGQGVHAFLESILDALAEQFDSNRGVFITTDRFHQRIRVDSEENALQISEKKWDILFRLNKLENISEPFLSSINSIIRINKESTYRISDESRIEPKYRRLHRSFHETLLALTNENFKILIPLIMRAKICGFILLGEKKNGEAYSSHDLRLLETLRIPVTLALINAIQHEELTLIKMQDEISLFKLTSFISKKAAIRHSVHGRTLLYQSEIMEKVMEQCNNAAASSFPVLVTGETGTGKELLARIIHESGKQRDHPFVALNCAAIPESLWEDEIFGHVKGAFTDAREKRLGRIAESGKGTLFFDEIGEMPQGMQAKLLRLLQEKNYSAIGSNTNHKARCRFIFATNQKLNQLIQKGDFREDLYYRINVLQILMPPLRKKKEDIPLLVDYYLEQFAPEFDSPVKSIDPNALAALLDHDWPGNVRELENTLIRSLSGARTEILQRKDLPFSIIERDKRTESYSPAVGHLSGAEFSGMIDFRVMVRNYRSQLILNALKKSNGNKTRAASLLNLKRSTLNSQIAELGIDHYDTTAQMKT